MNAKVIDVKFLDLKNGQYKFLSFFAKKARGLMAAYMVTHRAKTQKALRAFDWHGYGFAPERSSDTEWVFLRDRQSDYRG